MSHPSGHAPVVEMTGITIEFPGVKALDSVSFRLFPGEVHALMGENGAGKSTLIKALTGVYQIAAGTVNIDGKAVRITGTDAAQKAGISTVYQEVNLCGNLSVAENIMLGHEPRFGPFISWRALKAQAATFLARLHLDIDPSSKLSDHSIAVQQLCAIARSTVVQAKVLILDEPTSSLQQAEVDELFAVIRELRDQGVAILFVSHFLNQIYEISDRITVLRNGSFIGEYMVSDLPRLQLIEKMIGRSGAELEKIDKTSERRDPQQDATPIYQAAGLGKFGKVENVDITVHPGEIVGLAGLLGSGRTETARLMAGVDRPEHGETSLRGKLTPINDPKTALKNNIVYSSEDRKKEGIIGDLTVRENIALALQSLRGVWRPIPKAELDTIVERYLTALRIYPANPNMLIRNLSGGNQQKVLLARWLATQPELLILDEPTRGIDIGAKADIQRLVVEQAREGMGFVFISSEFEEVLRVSDRVLIFKDRVITDDLDNAEHTLTSTDILHAIAALTDAKPRDAAQPATHATVTKEHNA